MAGISISIDQMIGILNILVAILVPTIIGFISATVYLIRKITSLEKDIEKIKGPVEIIEKRALTEFLALRHPSADKVLKDLED